jgi:L-threonylcarbamoyladenylate synthase
MRTLLLEPHQIGEAAAVIRRGGLLVFPTETVYGLGASAWDDAACRRIFEAKGRPPDNPLIVHIAGAAMLAEVASSVPAEAERLFRAFSPGPLTLILPRGPRMPDAVTAGRDTVGVRIPSHPVAQKLLKACGMPVAAPSANLSGRPSPTSFHTAVSQMQGRVDAILDGGHCEHGLESTILHVSKGEVIVLREGAVTREMIREVLPDAAIRGMGENAPAGGDTGMRDGSPAREDSGAAIAPGTRHAHYQPAARVLAAEPEELPALLRRHAASRLGYIGLTPLVGPLATAPAISVYASGAEDYARRLYRSFYLFDAEGCTVIVAELPPARGIGRALRDRLRRAAG